MPQYTQEQIRQATINLMKEDEGFLATVGSGYVMSMFIHKLDKSTAHLVSILEKKGKLSADNKA